MSLIVSWHPTFAFFRNPYEWGAFDIDLDRFHRMIKGQLVKPPSFILTNPTARTLKALVKKARALNEPLSCDIETKPAADDRIGFTGKDPTRARLRTIGFGLTVGGVSLMWEGGRLVEREAKRILEDPSIKKVFHNGDWFDLRVLARYGIACRNVDDSRDARRAISSTSRLSLAYAASLYNDTHPWKENESDDDKGLVFTKSKRKIKHYNAQDCVQTSRVWAGIVSEPEWNTDRVREIYRVQREKARIAAEMHTHGVRVDPLMRQWMAWALLVEYREKERKFLKAVSIQGFECQPNHMRALIYRKHAKGKNEGLGRFNLPDPIDPAMYVDPKEMDAISVDEDALTLLLIDPSVPDELKGIIKLYWDAQEVWKRRSTFVVSAKVSNAIGPDNRLRAGWNSCGTDTYRFSCSEPNLMNIEQMMRAMYTVDPGNIMVGADFSQLELRVMAAVSGDRTLQEALKTGDVYSFDARTWFGLPEDMDVKKLKPAARKAAKIIHLGAQYGAGTKTIFQQALRQDKSFTWEQTVALHNAFLRTYNGTTLYWKEEFDRVCQVGYSESRILNRRRTYPREPPPTETNNYPIQSTASDVADLALLELDVKLKKHVPTARILMQLHDAYYVECRKKDEKTVRKITQECMEKPRMIGGQMFDFPAEIKSSDRWSDL